MSASVQPTTIASASVVIQVCLLLIAYVALLLLARSYAARAQARASYSTLVAWLLMTLIVLMMGEDYFSIWGPILGRVVLPAVPRDYAFLAVFVLDIVFVLILILRTGGAKRSPFTSVLFLLPTLAIFLREPVGRFLFYSSLVGVVYIAALRKTWKPADADFDRSEYAALARADEAIDDRATIWTNTTCLALATLIGIITAPT